MSERRIEYVLVDELRAAVRNPKDHDVGELTRSVERFGFTEPVVIDERTNRLAAGHGRVLALLRMQRESDPPSGIRADAKGRWLVPVVRGWASRDDAEADAYLVSSNRLTEIGGWNESLLAEVLRELSETSGLDGIGYDADDLDALLVSYTKEEESEVEPKTEAKDYKITLDAASLLQFERGAAAARRLEPEATDAECVAMMAAAYVEA